MSGPAGPGAGFCVVTGAFGYSGKYVARRLLAAGKRVRTLTNSPRRRDRGKAYEDLRRGS